MKWGVRGQRSAGGSVKRHIEASCSSCEEPHCCNAHKATFQPPAPCNRHFSPLDLHEGAAVTLIPAQKDGT
eukprot:2280126-Rhodomonas_salina.2